MNKYVKVNISNDTVIRVGTICSQSVDIKNVECSMLECISSPCEKCIFNDDLKHDLTNRILEK